MSLSERKSYLIAIKRRYLKAKKADKKTILDEFCNICNYNRKYAIRLLNKRNNFPIKKRTGRKPYRALLIEPIAAQAAIDQIALLYKNEKHIKDHITEASDALAYRQKHSEPLVTKFFAWIYEQRQSTDLTP